MSINHNATSISKFFTRQPLGNNSFDRIVKRVCPNESVSRFGSKNIITTHSLLGTLYTIIFEAGHSYSFLMMRTVHKDPGSLQHYQNLSGGEGLQQQRDLFGCATVRRPEGSAKTGRGDWERGDASTISY